MSKISIKIVEVHQPSQTVVVKFASEISQKSIDDYDGLAFSVPNYNTLTPEKFIEAITPQVVRLVAERDQSESLMNDLDVSTWQGFTVTVDPADLPNVEQEDPSQLFPGLSNPEVIL